MNGYIQLIYATGAEMYEGIAVKADFFLFLRFLRLRISTVKQQVSI